MKFRNMLYVALVLMFTGCGGLSLDDSSAWRKSTVREIPASELQKQAVYTLAPEDVLLIHVWGVPEFGASSSIAASNSPPFSRGALSVAGNATSSGGINAVVHGDG
ncbi:MAG: hypothetical protein Q9M27_02855, partial [Mariprofundaceae bacterium]|nr:hypothetical protein [Mariprofundaceae bacterium]